jgi:small subunit ribosomal protein S19
MSRIEAMNQVNEKRMIRTGRARRPSFRDGRTRLVHDGRKHVPVFITEQMVGYWRVCAHVAPRTR